MELASWVFPAIAFIPVLFAQGALLAGQIASRIFHNGQSLLSFKLTIVGFAGFFVAAVLAPLLVFIPKLVLAKRKGIGEYGAIASEYVMEFDQKWLAQERQRREMLGSADIQSLADLGNSFAVVRQMRAVPFATGDVVRLLVATLVPMAPLLLTIMPLEKLVTEAIKIVF